MRIKINLNVEELKEFAKSCFGGFTEAAFPNTTEALIYSQRQVYKAWTDYLAGETSLPNINNLDNVSRSMIESVKTRKNKEFDYSVYSDSKEMESIIQGKPAVDYDMKKTHPYGPRSRMSADNVPYLIVPFRWGTPNGKGTNRRWTNVIPQKDYRVNILPMEISQRTNKTHTEKNAKGQDVQRSEYSWGSRLSLDQAWDDNSVGMVRMKAEKGKGTYFTFRVISAKSAPDKWWYHKDSEPGVDIIGALKNKFDKDVTEAVKKGFEADLNELLL